MMAIEKTGIKTYVRVHTAYPRKIGEQPACPPHFAKVVLIAHNLFLPPAPLSGVRGKPFRRDICTSL